MTDDEALDDGVVARSIRQGDGLRNMRGNALTVAKSMQGEPGNSHAGPWSFDEAYDRPLTEGGPLFPAVLAPYGELRADALDPPDTVPDTSQGWLNGWWIPRQERLGEHIRLGALLGHVLAVCMVLLIGVQVRSFGLGLIAAVATAANVRMIDLSASGSSIPWGIALFLASIAFLLAGPARPTQEPADDRGWRSALPQAYSALSGLAMGAAYLAAPETLWLSLAVLLFLLRQSGSPLRGQYAGLYVGGFLLCALPWWIRNINVGGWPFYSLEAYQVFARAGDNVYHTINDPGSPQLAALLQPLQQLRDVTLPHLSDLIAGDPAAADNQQGLAELATLSVLALALATLLTRPAHRGERAVRQVLGFGTAAALLSALAWEYDPAFYAPLVPPLTILAVLGLYRFLVRTPRWTKVVAWTGLTILTLAPVATVATMPQPRTGPLPVMLGVAGKALPDNMLVITDIPAEVAFYADQPAIMAPADRLELAEIVRYFHERHISVAYLFSREFLAPDATGRARREYVRDFGILGGTRPVGYEGDPVSWLDAVLQAPPVVRQQVVERVAETAQVTEERAQSLINRQARTANALAPEFDAADQALQQYRAWYPQLDEEQMRMLFARREPDMARRLADAAADWSAEVRHVDVGRLLVEEWEEWWNEVYHPRSGIAPTIQWYTPVDSGDFPMLRDEVELPFRLFVPGRPGGLPPAGTSALPMMTTLITEKGQSVAPGFIEQALAASEHIDRAFVVGNGRPDVRVLIVPGGEATREMIGGVVERVNAGLAEHEQIAGWELLDHPLTAVDAIKRSPYVHDAVPFDDGTGGLVPLIHPDYEALWEWWAEEGAELAEPSVFAQVQTDEQLAATPLVRNLLRQEIDRLTQAVPQYEPIEHFTVSFTPDPRGRFDIWERRDAIEEAYSEEIAQVYSREAPPEGD
jgi:hypothetical protein